jgi:hypothetical protein
MQSSSHFKPLLIASAVALLTGAITFLVFNKSGPASPDEGVTTAQAAAASGARVEPTEPKLRIEPK